MKAKIVEVQEISSIYKPHFISMEITVPRLLARFAKALDKIEFTLKSKKEEEKFQKDYDLLCKEYEKIIKKHIKKDFHITRFLTPFGDDKKYCDIVEVEIL